MVRDDRAGFITRLGSVPVLDFSVKARLYSCIKFKALRGFFKVVGPVRITKPNQPFPILWNASYFFGNTRARACTTI